ncbi:MAG: hypothetical protein JWO31_3186 [Phycisphaerales bacterium]|nr:hypothetical protein [Phycisphaerales bacterium]
MNAATKDKQLPVGLIVAGELLLVVAAVRVAGSGAGPLLAYVGVASVVGVLLMLLTAFVVAAGTRQSFGEFDSAALKLAGTYLISNGLAAVLAGTGLGPLIGSAVFFSLMIWLFELELPYAIIFAILYWVVSLIVRLIVAGMLG